MLLGMCYVEVHGSDYVKCDVWIKLRCFVNFVKKG